MPVFRLIPNLLILLANTACAVPLFESRGEDLSGWEVLDLSGNGQAAIQEDRSVPSGHGPKVISLYGKELLLFAKGVRIEEGTILTLWKDVEPLENDSDGVILFGADYLDDIEVARNLKEKKTHSWIEQDSDEGFLVKSHQGSDNRETVVSTLPGVGLTQADWNHTGWIWQKLILSQEGLKAKYWAYGTPEPTWTLNLPDRKGVPGRVGLAIHSGNARVAYFAVSEEDISPELPEATLSVSPPVCYFPSRLSVKVLLNLGEPCAGASLSLALLDKGNEIWRQEFRKDFPAGNSVLEWGPRHEPLSWPEALPSHPIHLAARVETPAGGRVLAATALVEFRSATEFDEKISALATGAHTVAGERNGSESSSVRFLENASRLAHVRLAQERLASGDIEGVERALAFAEEADPSHPGIALRAYRSTSLSASSWVMGETYAMEVHLFPSESRPDLPLNASLQVTDDLGLETPISVDAPVSVEAWKGDGLDVPVSFRFRIPEEFPKGSLTPIANPAVREGWHRVWISLKRPDGSPEWLDMPKPNGGDFRSRYEIARVYITQNPVELGPIEPVIRENQGLMGLKFPLRNKGRIQFSGELTVTLLSECGNPIWATVQRVDLQKKWPVSIDFPLQDVHWFGNLRARIEVTRDGRLVTCAEKEIAVPAPEGWPIASVVRSTALRKSGKGLRTELVVHPTALEDSRRVAVEVRRKGALLERATLPFAPSRSSETSPQALLVEPIVGTYQVKISARCKDGNIWSEEVPIIGTVVTNNNGVLEMNGEPFLVKGVNVHGMISDSPERNRHLQRFLKDIGFNMLRGDYPPPWQVEMADEENIGYMVLAPFSVTHTDLLKERYGEHSFSKMREVSRRFIRTYRDLPAVWLWNSCNEIEGELDDFLVTLYPLYGLLDPAGRPVVYANLFGQDRTLGMDVMAVNYYYGPPYVARDRWPLIRRSIEEAVKAKVPCIYTEYNCWYGPVYSRGVESVEDFFVKGIEWGMQGGFQFMLPEHPDRHPGVIDTRERLRTNPTYVAALREAFADGELVLLARSRGSLQLGVKNRRTFALRKVHYQLEELGAVLAEGDLPDIAPEATGSIPPLVDRGTTGRILTIKLRFETHHGIRCALTDEVRLPGSRE